MSYFRVLFIALLCFNTIYLNAQSDKCTNSTDQYLCDPGFENSAYRNGTITYPVHRSYIGGTGLEVNRCLGGPDQGPPYPNQWSQPYFWFIYGPEYTANLPVHGVPDFLSWYVPTRGTSDYFNRHADTVLFDWQYIQSVDVPNNFIGWQQPAEGDDYDGYAGIWIQLYQWRDSTNTLCLVRHEYLQSKLKDTLYPGNTYRVSFNVNRAGRCGEDDFFYSRVNQETYLRKICAYFSEGPVTYAIGDYSSYGGAVDLPIDGSPQICLNNQPDQWLKDTTDWMTVSDYFSPDTKKAYITIGNFQDYYAMANDSVFACYRYQFMLPGYYTYPPMYYYIDNVRIELTSDTCNCCLHDIFVIPTDNSDSAHCCYSITLKSDSSTCGYNKILITDETTNTSQVYSNFPNDYPNNGNEYLITNNFCVPRLYDGSIVKLKFQFLRQNQDQTVDTLCYKYETVKCNCNCFNIESYHQDPKRLSIYSKRKDDSCCYDIFLLNNTDCQIPLKSITMFYEGTGFDELTEQANYPNWDSFRDDKQYTIDFFPANEPYIGYSSDPIKIGTVCVNGNGTNHPVSFKINLSSADSTECILDWNDNFKCSMADTNCCDLLHVSLLSNFERDSVLTSASVADGMCCWVLKVWQDQDLTCPIIKKMEVFDAAQLTVPLHSYDYPYFNNTSGKIFDDLYCIIVPIGGAVGTYINPIHLLVKFTFDNDSICIKPLDDSCAITVGHQQGGAKKGDFSINKENIINLDNITIKPNPFSDKTSIEFTLDKEEFVSLEVYNSIGDRLSTLVSSSLGKGSHKQILEGESYPNGAYYLKFTHGDKSVTIPIVKIK